MSLKKQRCEHHYHDRKGTQDEMNMKNSFNSQFRTKMTKEEECILENVTIVEESKEVTIKVLDLVDWMVVKHMIIDKLTLTRQ